MSAQEAIEKLQKCKDRNEEFHEVYDDVMLERLKEVDPEFFKAVDDYYGENVDSRWYA